MLLHEVNSKYCGLLIHNNVMWLSCGHVLESFVKCLTDIKTSYGSQEAETLPTTSPKMVDILNLFSEFPAPFNEFSTNLQCHRMSVSGL
jgi:hypothetical protein